jgi:DNA-binding Xre family transcriptional regulator
MRKNLSRRHTMFSPYRLRRDEVKVLMIRKGLRNVDLARIVGVHPSLLSYNIVGKGRNLSIQKAVAEALGVPLTRIVVRVDKSQRQETMRAA